MRLSVVYDNEGIHEKFLTGWGFSCFVEYDNTSILFDTGWDGTILLHNLSEMGIDVREIDVIVVSHEHWDHIGGLPDVLGKVKKKVDIFLPSTVSRRLREEIGKRSEVHAPYKGEKVCEGVFTTGSLLSEYGSTREESLVLKGKKGLTVVTGCAHPGLGKILETARKMSDERVYAVIGGFHDFKDLKLLSDVDIIAPCHCTMYKKEIYEKFPDRVLDAKVGSVIEI